LQPGCLKQLPHNLELPEPLVANPPQGLLAFSGLRTFPDEKREPTITFSVNKSFTNDFTLPKLERERRKEKGCFIYFLNLLQRVILFQ
jgi:hypothetical protein